MPSPEFFTDLSPGEKVTFRAGQKMKTKAYKPTAEEMKKLEQQSTDKPGTIEYPHHAGSFQVEKLNSKEIKNTALVAMHQQTEMQLSLIYEQVELLAQQARKIKNRAQISRKIYQAQMSFRPKVGKTYFLYQNPKGQDVLSMISPKEWGEQCPYQPVAVVTLLADQTWAVEENYDH